MAQGPPDPVQWSLTAKSNSVRPGRRVLAILTAAIEDGWHLYSLTTPKGGPNATTVKFTDSSAVARIRIFQPPPVRTFDPNFHLDTETFTKELPLLLEVTTEGNGSHGPVDLEAQVRYQACKDTLCLAPRTKSVKVTLQIDPSAKPERIKIGAGYEEVVRH